MIHRAANCAGFTVAKGCGENACLLVEPCRFESVGFGIFGGEKLLCLIIFSRSTGVLFFDFFVIFELFVYAFQLFADLV